MTHNVESEHFGSTVEVPVDRSHLQPLTMKPSLSQYLQDLWSRRYFILADAKGKSFRTTRDYTLWRLWLLIEPLTSIVVFAFVFGFVLKTSRGIESFLSFLTIGTIFFGFLTSLVSSGVNLIQVNRNLIASFNFPRAAVVVSHTVRYFLDHLIPAGVAIVAALLLRDTIGVSWTILLVVPIYILMHMFGLGFMFIVARLSAFHPETKVFVSLFTQAWFFVSGVFFSVERFVDNPGVQKVMVNNPGYQFLQAVRDCVVYDRIPSLQTWGVLLGWSIGLCLVGLIFFWLAEDKYASID